MIKFFKSFILLSSPSSRYAPQTSEARPESIHSLIRWLCSVPGRNPGDAAKIRFEFVEGGPPNRPCGGVRGGGGRSPGLDEGSPEREQRLGGGL